MTPPTREELREELENLREDGFTRKEIAEHYSVSLSQVKRWISDLNVHKKVITKNNPPKLPSKSSRLPDDAGLTVLEKAKKILGPRLSMGSLTYFLDGRPASVMKILDAACVTAKRII